MNNIPTQLIPKICLFIFLFVGTSGCDDDNPSEDDTQNSTCAESSSPLILDEAHNYSFSSDVNIKVYEMQEYPNVPFLDWSGLTKDILGREVKPEDIGHVEIIVWNLDNYDAFKEWMNEDSLDMEKLESMINLEPELISRGGASLSEFTSGGMDVDAEQYFRNDGQFPVNDYIFVLVVGRGEVVGSDAISAAFLRPVSDLAAPTEMSLENTSVSFTYDAVFSNTPYSVQKDAVLAVDWSYMLGSSNALGQEFTPNHAGKIMLMFYQNKLLQDLQDQFLNLEHSGDRTYSFEPKDAAPTFELSALAAENGEAFPGFGNDEGTWLLSLWCTSSCNNPAPKYLTSIVPCSK